MAKKWFDSGVAKGVEGVDKERGVIFGAKVITEGEAKGHGVFIDSQFAADTAEQGQAIKAGVKARFGHPNMCSTALGTFLGRWKNFRVDGDAVRADLYLSNSAKKTPDGDLYNYVLDMAADEHDMFGTSIVFTIGGYKLADGTTVADEFDVPEGEKVFVELGALHACDAVDEPAANEGLFSRFSGETIAGQVTEFFDLHPEMVTALTENDSVIEAIVERGGMFREFLNKYNSRIESAKQGEEKMSDPVVEPELLEAVEVEVVEPVEAEAVEVEAEEVEALDAEAEVEVEAVEVEAEVEEVEVDDSLAAQLSALSDEFGAEIAVKVFGAEDPHAAAMSLKAEALEAKVEALSKDNAALREKAGKKSDVAPVEFASTDGEPPKTVCSVLFGNK